MNFSVVIPTYRRAVSLEATLESIVRQGDAVREVIVVSQSEDETHEAVATMMAKLGAGSSQLRLLRLASPSSTAARNAGIAAATGDWIIFSDDDVIWPDGLLVRLTAKLSAAPDIAMLAARDLSRAETPLSTAQRWFGAFFLVNTWAALTEGRILPSIQGRYPSPIRGDVPTEWAMGYWFAVRRDHLAAHGLRFDERMTRYAYAEDLLFSVQCARAAKRSGLRSVLSEDVAVRHLATDEWRTSARHVDLAFAWNRIFIASQLYAGAAFWFRLPAIGWSMVHQVISRLIRRRPWAYLVYAHLLGLIYLGRIRAGELEPLYRRHLP